jgi:hypothetical protein
MPSGNPGFRYRWHCNEAIEDNAVAKRGIRLVKIKPRFDQPLQITHRPWTHPLYLGIIQCTVLASSFFYFFIFAKIEIFPLTKSGLRESL